MTFAEAKKRALPEVAEVTSDFTSAQSDFRGRKRKSLATSANGSAPLSLREREREEGSYKTGPSLLSPPTLPLPPEKSRALAAYAGAISRWCDLTGNVPDVRLYQDKIAAEFAAFNHHLDELAYEARRIKSLQF